VRGEQSLFLRGNISADTVDWTLGGFLLQSVLIADTVRDFPNIFEVSHARQHNTHGQFANYAFQFLIGLGYGRHLVRLTFWLDAALGEMLQLYMDAGSSVLSL